MAEAAPERLLIDLFAALKGATQSDLDAIDGEIADLRGQLKSLGAVRNIIATRLGADQPKKKAATNGNVSRGRPVIHHPLKVAVYILHNGPTRPAILQEECGIPRTSLDNVLANTWFQRTPNGIALTTEGRKAAENAV